MGKKFECYFYEESMFPLMGSMSTKYHVSRIEPAGNLEHIVYNILGVAREANHLFSKNGNEYTYDNVIFYSSLDDKTDGKPHVIATRDGTILMGVSNASDILYTLRREIDNIVRELKSTEHSITLGR